MSDDVYIGAESLLGGRTGLALVKLVMGEHSTTMPAEKAEEIAMILLECASAARMDKGVYEVLTQKFGLPAKDAAGVIQEIRTHRNN